MAQKPKLFDGEEIQELVDAYTKNEADTKYSSKTDVNKQLETINSKVDTKQNKVLIGTTEPLPTLGEDSDIYIQIEV